MNPILIILTLLLSNSYTNFNSSTFEEFDKTTTYSKVSYYEKDNMLIYEYESGFTIEVVQSRKGSQMIINNNGRYVATLSGSGGNLIYQGAKKGNVYKGSSIWLKVDKTIGSVLLSHHLLQGKTELSYLFGNDRNVTKLEASLIEDMSGASSYGRGTVTTSCSCNGTTVTVTCPEGCGGICERQTKRRCHYGPDGTEESCEDIEVCVGLCLC